MRFSLNGFIYLCAYIFIYQNEIYVIKKENPFIDRIYFLLHIYHTYKFRTKFQREFDSVLIVLFSLSSWALRLQFLRQWGSQDIHDRPSRALSLTEKFKRSVCGRMEWGQVRDTNQSGSFGAGDVLGLKLRLWPKTPLKTHRYTDRGPLLTVAVENHVFHCPLSGVWTWRLAYIRSSATAMRVIGCYRVTRGLTFSRLRLGSLEPRSTLQSPSSPSPTSPGKPVVPGSRRPRALGGETKFYFLLYQPHQ